MIGKASERDDTEKVRSTAMVEARGVEKSTQRAGYASTPCGAWTLHSPRRDGRRHGTLRLRQDDAPQLPLRPRRVRRGEVLIGGESISGMSDRKRTRFRAERMGFIFQTYNLIPVLSAVENVELPLLVAGARPKEARRRRWRPWRWLGSRSRLTSARTR